jgi:hypothetical protein
VRSVKRAWDKVMCSIGGKNCVNYGGAHVAGDQK